MKSVYFSAVFFDHLRAVLRRWTRWAESCRRGWI